MAGHDIYANNAHDIQHKGQAALWVTHGCTSMSKPITTSSAPMGVDNNYYRIVLYSTQKKICCSFDFDISDISLQY